MHKNFPIVKLYHGYASSTVTCIRGHVLRSVSPQREKITANPLKNALEMYRRYRVKPASGQSVGLYLHDRVETVASDKRGFFQFRIPTPDGVSEMDGTVALPEWPGVGESFHVRVSDPGLIIISDVDDTILVSHSTSFLKKLYLLLTKNHQARRAVKGILEFYTELHQQQEAKFFYVSSSEWNLYDFLKDFVRFSGLPDGVFLLQDIKSGLLDLFKSGGGSHSHKRIKIESLLGVYPEAGFVLIGDSGQKDPEIYRQIVLGQPSRIKGVFIRDIRKSRRQGLQKMISELEGQGVQMQIFSDEKLI